MFPRIGTATGGVRDPHDADVARRVQALQMEGRVVEVKYDPPRARVQCGGNVTDWIPMASGRSGRSTDWRPVKVGEQVVVTNPGGNMAGGFISASLDQSATKPPDYDANVEGTYREDGSSSLYNYASGIFVQTGALGGVQSFVQGRCSIVIYDDRIEFHSPNASMVLT